MLLFNLVTNDLKKNIDLTEFDASSLGRMYSLGRPGLKLLEVAKGSPTQTIRRSNSIKCSVLLNTNTSVEGEK